MYPYREFITMKEEDIIGMMSSSMEIFASYYTDICQNYYPSPEQKKEQDPLAAALGSKLVYRQPPEVPGPEIIYSSISEKAAGKAGQSKGRSTLRGEDRMTAAVHPDRSEQGFRLYPKNTLIKGAVKTAKYHTAILTAVGIIEGKEYDMVSIEPVPDILERYMGYVEEGRILQISCPDFNGNGYGGWIEAGQGGYIRDGIFKEFANHCASGRYVVMMEDVDLDWMQLFGEALVLLRENRREGTSSETTITLPASKDKFKLPSNLYIVATCDCVVCEDTIVQAVYQDFFIRHVNPQPGVLQNMRVEGITLERLMTILNLRISYFLGADYQLGEGFFLTSLEKEPMVSLGRVFREQIIPLLEKWFDGDIERIRYVLGDNGKTDPDTVFYQELPFRRNLFKGQLPDYFDTERVIYQINEKAFFNPKSFIGVYQ